MSVSPRSRFDVAEKLRQYNEAMIEKGLLDNAEKDKPKHSGYNLSSYTNRLGDEFTKWQSTWSLTPTACFNLLRPTHWFRAGTKVDTKLHRTAYLDGLRGFAAFMVYCLHHQVWGHNNIHGEFILENGYGYDRQYYFICLPFIRIFFSGGHVAVAIFFVISGYVLSVKGLSLIHSGQVEHLANNLGSALFRRWFRLFLPVIGTTFVWATLWHVLGIKSSNPITPPPQSNYRDEIWHWYCAIKNFSFIFTGEPQLIDYNDHTWSIPAEFRGSIVVYTALLGLSRCRKTMRLWCECGLVIYFTYIVDGWFCALFMIGMLLADLDLLAQKDELPEWFELWRPAKTYIFWGLFIAGLYLAGVPSITNDLPHLADTPGWYLLSLLKPQAFWDFRWYYRVLAATCIVSSLPHLPVKKIFETRFVQYLGRISFGFYLVHGPVLWSVGDRMYAAFGRVREGHMGIVPTWVNIWQLPSWGPFGLEVNYLVPHLILLPLTLWLAELITRFMDEPSVRIARWLEDLTKDTSPNKGSMKEDAERAKPYDLSHYLGK